jgi:UDP-glucose 4-epimerase
MNILVTGGAGFIGSHLVDALLLLGHKVTVYDDLSSGKRENINGEADFILQDVTSAVHHGERFDLVYHLAAKARVVPSFEHPLEYHKNNVLGTATMLEFARKCGAKRFILASSSSIYGGYGKEDMPFREDMAPRPTSPYAFDKALGEQLCAEYSRCYGLSCVALRFFNVYGPRMASGQYSTVIQAFLDAKREGRKLPMRGDGLHTRDYTHVSDVVRALLYAAEADLPFRFAGFNVGGGENHSVREVAQLIGGEVENLPAVEEPTDTLASLEQIREHLGWEPKTKFKDGVTALVLAERIKANG